jgi:LemA protein
MKLSQLPRFALVLFGSLALASCGINSVPTAEENAKAKWADVQAAFQERANLIPNLAEVAQGSAAQERAILTDVIEARAKATSIQVSAEDLNDPAKVAQFQAAQNQLGAGLGRLLASVEAYPDLKSIPNFTILMSQLEGQENRIRISIRDYNEAVRQYNTTIRTFPSTIAANVIYGSDPMVPYEAVTPGAEVAPTLDLTPDSDAAPGA